MTKKLMASLFAILTVFLLVTQSNNARAAAQITVHKTSYLSMTSVTSKVDGMKQEEEFTIPTTTSKSLWFNDGTSSRQVVRTHNNPSVLHYPGGKVEIIVYQEGVGSKYYKIDGNNTGSGVQIDTIESEVSETKQYSITRYIIDYDQHVVDKDAPYTIFTVGNIETTNPGTSTPYTRYEANVYIYWNYNLPAAPSVSFVYDKAVNKMVLSGADSTMEYRLKSATSDRWQPCTNETMYFDATGTENTTYYVRYSANGTQTASQVKELILPGKQAAPSATYNRTTETISGLSTAMEIQFDEGEYTPLSATTLNISDIIDTIPADKTLSVNIRRAASGSSQAGLSQVLTINTRADAPTSVIFNPIPISLTGYSSGMEFQTDTDTGWRNMPGTELKLLNYASAERDVTVYIRVKPTAANSASKSVEITIPKLLAGPTGTLEYDKEIISGLANGNYQYNTGAPVWGKITITDGIWNISRIISSSTITLSLRAAETETTPVSAVSLFTLPARSAAPTTPTFVYNDIENNGKAVLTGLTDKMEYRTNTSTVWTAATGANVVMDVPAPSASTTFYVRYQPTTDSFGSSVQTLYLKRAGTAPSTLYNTTTEQVTGINNQMEIKIGTGPYTSVERGVTTYDMASLVNDIAAGSTLTFTARIKATATAPASLEKVLTIYPRLAAPATVVFNTAPLTLTGYTSAMQYRLDSDASTYWRSMSGTTLSLEKFASAEHDVTIYVRMKPTTTASASSSVQFTIPMLVTGPTGTIDYFDESITNLANGSYQYSTNGTAWTTVSVTNGSCDISSLITTSARTIYLRKAATATSPVTAYTTFAIPRRPAAPSTPKFVYNDTNNPDKIVFSGLTTDMQYRRSTDTTWIAVPDSGLVYEPQDTAIVYYVRKIATNDTWASAYKTITMVAMPAAPSISYNESTEVLSKLGTAYEISFDGGAYTALTSSTYNLSGLIDNIAPSGTLEVNVRKKASASAPAGHNTTIIINARILQFQQIEEDVVLPPEHEADVVLPPEHEEDTESFPEHKEGSSTPSEVELIPEN